LTYPRVGFSFELQMQNTQTSQKVRGKSLVILKKLNFSFLFGRSKIKQGEKWRILQPLREICSKLILSKRAKEELQKSFVKGLVANKFLNKGNKAWER
jgi:hypothetical protein